MRPTAAWRNSGAGRALPVRWLLGVLLVLLVLLQYRLWFAEGSLAERQRLLRQAQEQREINAQLRERNAVLEREVLELQNGNRGVEQRAREQLGLVRQGEIYFHVVEEDERGEDAAP